MEILVQTNNLTKQYGQHKAVNNVNLSVKKGEIYGLAGRNGAGKTTVLRLISGLAKATEENVCLFEKNGQIGMHSAKSVYARAIVIGLIFLLSEIVLLCMVMNKKEIKYFPRISR